MDCKLTFKPFYIFFVISILFFHAGYAEEDTGGNKLMEKAPKVFLDGFYDLDYIRTEIPFVNYVRDRNDADIHILSTLQGTGGGGREYTLKFIGQKEFKNVDDEFVYVSNRTDSDDERRNGLANSLKMGLTRYIARTPLAEHVSISFDKNVESEPLNDKWKNWVFQFRFNTVLSGEAAYRSQYLRGSFSANRVTEKWKLNFFLHSSINKDDYEIDGKTYSDKQEDKGFHGAVVKSIGNHWSAGFIFRTFSSTYDNNELSLMAGPAVEYDLFPYSESTRKLLTFYYSPAYRYNRYMAETIYNKTKERLLSHLLIISYVQKTKWGSFRTTLEGLQYFHDLSKNRLQLYGDFSIRILKGLSFEIWGRYCIIHDQLSLEKGNSTMEEILLRQRQLATTYNYSIYIGFSYCFGSIYNNIVNPRFLHR